MGPILEGSPHLHLACRVECHHPTLTRRHFRRLNGSVTPIDRVAGNSRSLGRMLWRLVCAVEGSIPIMFFSLWLCRPEAAPL